MRNKVTVRRAGKRWREDAPEWVVDCFDNVKFIDRYTVIVNIPDWPEGLIVYFSLSGSPDHPQGFSQSGEMNQAECHRYRYMQGHCRIRWLDLPEHVRKHVVSRVEQINNAC